LDASRPGIYSRAAEAPEGLVRRVSRAAPN